MVFGLQMASNLSVRHPVLFDRICASFPQQQIDTDIVVIIVTTMRSKKSVKLAEVDAINARDIRCRFKIKVSSSSTSIIVSSVVTHDDPAFSGSAAVETGFAGRRGEDQLMRIGL
jgi:hypothetical protein